MGKTGYGKCRTYWSSGSLVNMVTGGTIHGLRTGFEDAPL